MTSYDDIDRRLTDWLEEDAAPRAPESLETAFIEGVAGTRQRPAWATTGRWISMENRARLGAVPRLAIVALTILLLAAMTAGTIAVGASLMQQRVPPPFGLAANGLIAYDALGDIWTAEADGSDARQLTGDGSIDAEPVFSRDGRSIAYWSRASIDQPWDLRVMDADGSDGLVIATGIDGSSTALTHPAAPVWSPEGDRMIFDAFVPELTGAAAGCPSYDGQFCGSRLFTAATDGSGFARIGDPDLDARSPAWSPTGDLIVFGGAQGDMPGLYAMDPSGGDVQRIGQVSGVDWSFIVNSWSPDGERVVTQLSGFPHDVVAVDVSTGEVTVIADSSTDEWLPVWSPDGSAISMVVGAAATVVDLDGGDQLVLDPDTGYLLPMWSPDGELLTVDSPQLDEIRIYSRSGELTGTLATQGRFGKGSWQRLVP